MYRKKERLSKSYTKRAVTSIFKVQMTKIYIPVSSLQIYRHCFKDHNAENRIQKFHLIPEI